MLLRFAISIMGALGLFIGLSGCSRSGNSHAQETRSPMPASESGAVPGGARAEAPWFEDITAAVGLDFKHDSGAVGAYFMPESTGSGGALLDFDNDGRLDIYLVHNGGPNPEGGSPKSKNRLFHQESDGRFRDVSAGSGLDVSGYGMGVAVGDLNNDGLPEVLLTEYGNTRLFRNLGGGRFKDVTHAAGIDNTRWATAAAFFDYDRDGWLDLVVVNYLDYSQTI